MGRDIAPVAGQSDHPAPSSEALHPDVLVVGGGPAGLAAAVAAARQGCSTMLLERYGFVGGTPVAALVGPMMTFHAGSRAVVGGIGQEIVDKLVQMEASPGHVPDMIGFVPSLTPFDPEALKDVALDLVLGSGVQLCLHCCAASVQVDRGRIESVRAFGRWGELEIHPAFVVDATGDADIAARGGFSFEIGRPGDGLVQPATLILRVGGVDLAELRQYVADHPDDFVLGCAPGEIMEFPWLSVAGFFSIVKKARERGEFGVPRDRVLAFQGIHPGEMLINMTRVHVRPGSLQELTRAEVEGRRQSQEVLRFLRRYVPGFRQAYLMQSGVQVGFRESRRIVGHYVLTARDVVQGSRLPDAVAMGGFPIDIHSPAGKGLGAYQPAAPLGYEIPLRALIPAGAKNLLVAGRCISSTHEAHASVRATPTCFATGQAAGTAAAVAAKEGILDLSSVADLQAVQVGTAAATGGAKLIRLVQEALLSAGAIFNSSLVRKEDAHMRASR
ncbi:MAG: FAD-dependent oxidoreductase [Firmicutes bacterium]|nr:FAD-dependent oxidoreductase [Bacillota bacterium]